MWSHRQLQNLIDDLRIRLQKRKSNEWLFTPWYWIASWTRHNLGYFTLTAELGAKVHARDFFSAYLKELVLLFVGKSPKLVLPQQVVSVKTEVVLWSWLLEGDITLIALKRDRYFGDLSEFSNKLLRIHTLVGRFSKNEILEATRLGAAVIEAQWDALKPVKVAFFFTKLLYRRPQLFFELWRYLNSRFYHSYVVEKQMHAVLSNLKELKYFLIPYESQPEQRKILDSFRDRPSVKRIGYIHAALPSFPSEYIHYVTDVDCLLVHGTAYQRFFEDVLGWKGTCPIVTIPSLRYVKKSGNYFNNKLFLPYYIPNLFNLLDELKMALKVFRFWKAEIAIHPANIPGHSKLKEDLQLFMKELANENQGIEARTDLSIVVGISSVMFECLEAGNETIQISLENGDDFFDVDIWEKLDVQSISPTCRSYFLKEAGSYITYGSETYGFRLNSEFLSNLDSLWMQNRIRIK